MNSIYPLLLISEVSGLKVHHLYVSQKVKDEFLEFGMRWVLVDIVVPVFGALKFYDESVGERILSWISRDK